MSPHAVAAYAFVFRPAGYLSGSSIEEAEDWFAS